MIDSGKASNSVIATFITPHLSQRQNPPRIHEGLSGNQRGDYYHRRITSLNGSTTAQDEAFPSSLSASRCLLKLLAAPVLPLHKVIRGESSRNNLPDPLWLAFTALEHHLSVRSPYGDDADHQSDRQQGRTALDDVWRVLAERVNKKDTSQRTKAILILEWILGTSSVGQRLADLLLDVLVHARDKRMMLAVASLVVHSAPHPNASLRLAPLSGPLASCAIGHLATDKQGSVAHTRLTRTCFDAALLLVEMQTVGSVSRPLTDKMPGGLADILSTLDCLVNVLKQFHMTDPFGRCGLEHLQVMMAERRQSSGSNHASDTAALCQLIATGCTESGKASSSTTEKLAARAASILADDASDPGRTHDQTRVVTLFFLMLGRTASQREVMVKDSRIHSVVIAVLSHLVETGGVSFSSSSTHFVSLPLIFHVLRHILRFVNVTQLTMLMRNALEREEDNDDALAALVAEMLLAREPALFNEVMQALTSMDDGIRRTSSRILRRLLEPNSEYSHDMGSILTPLATQLLLSNPEHYFNSAVMALVPFLIPERVLPVMADRIASASDVNLVKIASKAVLGILSIHEPTGVAFLAFIECIRSAGHAPRFIPPRTPADIGTVPSTPRAGLVAVDANRLLTLLIEWTNEQTIAFWKATASTLVLRMHAEPGDTGLVKIVAESCAPRWTHPDVGRVVVDAATRIMELQLQPQDAPIGHASQNRDPEVLYALLSPLLALKMVPLDSLVCVTNPTDPLIRLLLTRACDPDIHEAVRIQSITVLSHLSVDLVTTVLRPLAGSNDAETLRAAIGCATRVTFLRGTEETGTLIDVYGPLCLDHAIEDDSGDEHHAHLQRTSTEFLATVLPTTQHLLVLILQHLDPSTTNDQRTARTLHVLSRTFQMASQRSASSTSPSSWSSSSLTRLARQVTEPASRCLTDHPLLALQLLFFVVHHHHRRQRPEDEADGDDGGSGMSVLNACLTCMEETDDAEVVEATVKVVAAVVGKWGIGKEEVTRVGRALEMVQGKLGGRTRELVERLKEVLQPGV
ncbi:hypothetical protein HKX48_002837 [Thoreauomyces humboldtii]|nr:hypothetical protein HKX48_002837 [Thoreauomyces humboldtii]